MKSGQVVLKLTYHVVEADVGKAHALLEVIQACTSNKRSPSQSACRSSCTRQHAALPDPRASAACACPA